jgi:lipopolysaccharide export system permease protein
MMAVLLTFLRLSADNEIIALKTGGLTIYRLLVPVLLFCLVGCLLTLSMAVYGLPWGRIAIKEQTLKVISSNLDVGLKERTFNDSFKDVMLYVNKIDVKNRALIDVFIEDKRTKNIVSTVLAPRGKLFSDPGELVFHLRLFQGIINQVELENRSANTVFFDTYDLRLDLKKAAVALSAEKHRKEMSVSELYLYVKNTPVKDEIYYKLLMELHKKFSIPLACFALGLLAVPLGIQSRLAKRSSGLVLGLIFFLIYYLLLSAGMVFGETGVYPPLIGMWLPNVVMGGIGVYLLVRTANERPVFIGFVVNIIQRLSFKDIRKLYPPRSAL